MKFDLSQKKALISGGSHGIGKAIALTLTQAGASVAIMGRNLERLENTKRELSKHGTEVLIFKCDVLNENEVLDTWNQIEDIWGGVDILINNVGGGGRWGSSNVLETSLKTWEEVIRKNLGVSIQLTKYALGNMKTKGWGRVLFITSIYGVSIGGRPWFNIAKVGQTTLMKNLARNPDFTRKGITFNSIAPGAVYIEETGWSSFKNEDPIGYKVFLEKLPLGRLGLPEEVASLALFICSEESALLNGSTIVLDGGESIDVI